MKYYTIDELKEDFLFALSMSSVPDFCKVKPDHVFDEDKSVRWNKEEAINKVKEAGLIFTTDDYANNSGYIKNIILIKENFCL